MSSSKAIRRPPCCKYNVALVPKTERFFILTELIRNAKIVAVNGKMLVLLIKFAEMARACWRYNWQIISEKAHSRL